MVQLKGKYLNQRICGRSEIAAKALYACELSGLGTFSNRGTWHITNIFSAHSSEGTPKRPLKERSCTLLYHGQPKNPW